MMASSRFQDEIQVQRKRDISKPHVIRNERIKAEGCKNYKGKILTVRLLFFVVYPL